MITNEFIYFSLWLIGFFSVLLFIDTIQNRLYMHIKRMPLCHAFFLPGVVFHELSHWFMCILMRRKVTSVDLYRFDHSTGTLGSVSFLSPVGPASWLPNMLIGMAPLFTSAILFTFFLRSVGEIGGDGFESLLHEWSLVLSMVLGGDVAWWLILGLLSLSYSAIPSISDLKISRPGIILLYALTFLLWRLDQGWLVTAAIAFMQLSLFRLISVSIPSIALILVFILSKLLSRQLRSLYAAVRHG